MSSKNSRLMGPAQVATGPATVYTAPNVAGRCSIVDALQISNPSASAVTLTISIGADAAGTRVYGAYSVPANTNLIVYPKWVLAAAEIIQLSAGTNNTLVVTMNGREYESG